MTIRMDLMPGPEVSSGASRAIPIARPILDSEEAEAVARVLRTGWISQGPEVAAFEEDFAAATGARHACAVANCTAALHLALIAFGVGADDEVVTVSHSFIATANAVRYTGARPVFVDVDRVNGNILPDRIEEALTARTKALLVVHQLGMPCDLTAILDITRRRGLPVIEDAACAIGSEILVDGRWEAIGRPHGDVACFSFHPRKVVTTGDGGMLTTADRQLDAQFRLLRQHGMSVSDRVRHGSNRVIAEQYGLLGYNYRMTDIQAAVGRVQLRRLPAMIRERREMAAVYGELLCSVPGLRLPQEPNWAKSNWQSYLVRLPGEANQTAVMQCMLDSGISTRRGVMCSHREPAYRGADWRAGRSPVGGQVDLPNSEWLQDHGVLLPLFPGLSRGEQEIIADRLRASLALARP
ncbi:MAG: DegT/DnrJ/EryC1/StrS family aminotransferase [Xanthobacteraceae bacterium]|nr:DegT/DnrJ/EryC1/StrS family aminotransferase [Xanthobacteraceae bacterium]